MTRSADVVVVGSGPAGCSSAMLLARAGLRVILLEAHHDPAFYKRLCTHAILPSGAPAIRRLGIDDLLADIGAIRQHERIWTRYGWVVRPDTGPSAEQGYCVRRQTLDPLLREKARQTPGLELILGARMRELTRDGNDRVDGVVTDIAGVPQVIHSRLVVGADGAASKVAALSGLPGKAWTNDRFVCFAYYQGVQLPAGVDYAVWIRGADVVYHFPTEGDLTVLVASLNKDKLPAFRDDSEATLLAAFAGVDNGPDLSAARRTSAVIATKDYPSLTRRRVTAPGVALIGDAALVSDPLWGAGCAWAFQSAEWLSDAIADALHTGSDRDIDAAAQRYQRQHRRRIRLHHWHSIDFSRRGGLRAVERMVMAGGVHNPRVAGKFWDFQGRNGSPLSLVSPMLTARAAASITANAARGMLSRHPPMAGFRTLHSALGVGRRQSAQPLIDTDRGRKPEVTLGGTDIEPVRR